MKRKFLLLALALVALFLMTACEYRSDIDMEVFSDGKVSMDLIIGYDDEFLDAFMSMQSGENAQATTYTDEERWAFLEKTFSENEDYKGVKLEKYEDEKFKGYSYTLKYDSIDELVAENEDELSSDGAISASKEKKMFLVKDGIYVLSLSGNNLNNNAENAEQLEESGVGSQAAFRIKLPKEAITNNADEVSSDKLTYTWDVMKAKKIELSFKLDEKPTTTNSRPSRPTVTRPGTNTSVTRPSETPSKEDIAAIAEAIGAIKKSGDLIAIKSGDLLVVPSKPADEKKDDTTEKENKITWSKASSWATEELEKALSRELIPDIFNKEDLTKNITRKEFAHVAVKLYENISGQKAIASAKNPFTDTKDTEVLKAYNVGITAGTSETTFAPDTLITREQMATMMVRALEKAGVNTSVNLDKVEKFVDDDEMHSWGRTAIYFMSNAGVIKGVSSIENRYGVTGNATREQALLISTRSVDSFAK